MFSTVLYWLWKLFAMRSALVFAAIALLCMTMGSIRVTSINFLVWRACGQKVLFVWMKLYSFIIFTDNIHKHILVLKLLKSWLRIAHLLCFITNSKSVHWSMPKSTWQSIESSKNFMIVRSFYRTNLVGPWACCCSSI